MATLFYDRNSRDPIADVILADAQSSVDCFAIDELVGEPIQGIESAGLTGEFWVGNRKVQLDSPLINRITKISASSLERINADLNVFEKFKATSAFVARLIELFPCRTGGPGVACLAGNYFPLNNQWYMVNSSCLRLSVPKSHYAFGYETAGATLDSPIVCDPNEFERVVAETNFSHQAEKMWNAFAFEKPKGKAVVCAILGDAVQIRAMNHNKELGDDEFEKVATLVFQLTQLFDVRVAEFVLFVDTEMTFGYFSHRFEHSQKWEGFSSFVERGVASFQSETRS